MRVLIAVLLAALPGVAAAQSRSVPDPAPPLPTIGLPLPTIGLPLPSPPNSRTDSRVDRNDRRPPARREPGDGDGDRRDRRGGDRRGGHRPSVVYVVPAYGFGYPAGGPPSDTAAGTPAPSNGYEEAPPQKPGPPTGTLWLDLQSGGGAQVYVDRVYVGTMEDVHGQLTLEAGTHSVAVRAPGYQPIEIDVKVEADRMITYRGALQPEGAAATAGTRQGTEKSAAAIAKVEKAVTRKPFYAIPGCYLGDVPPKDANLPANCDPSKAVTIWP
jgi:hypothetical protein